MKALSTRRKVFLLAALLLAGGVASAQVVIKGNVYGGGEGTRENEKHGLVTGNTSVAMNGGTVEQSIYGGGELGSVGTFTDYDTVVYTHTNNVPNDTVYIPNTCTSGTGIAKVILNGGQVGILSHALMPHPGTSTWDDANGYIFAGSRGEADSISYPQAIALAVVDSTYLEVNGVVITASIYGGCENGLVLRNTYVKVKGGQIGIGHYKDQGGDHIVPAYSLDQWNNAIAKVKAETFTDSDANGFYDCDAWPYGRLNSETHLKDYLVYDPFAHPDSAYYNQAVALGGSLYASDGSSFFGNVFGGGSGYYPIAPGVWRRTAGQVNGNTQIDIEGGHILTAVYGGNELTDVIQKATINMTGGTVGIPRVFDSIAANPMNGHIFASGKGDMRTLFNRWTNVGSTEVNISGGVVFGSVYGGGEDGHVLGDVALNITENNADTRPVIGTFGYSTFDGNVFGSGRGFLGNAYTAGSVGGNVVMNITGGKVLGDVYGGGRLASVGSYFVDPQMVDPETGTLIDNPNYGQLQNGTNHGYVTINIHGVTLGNSRESDIGGNVYGGSMGRLTDLNHQINDMWPDLAKVKETTVNIGNSDATTVIKGNVFGGGEIGTVTQNTTVNLTPNSTTEGTVYGGGLGYCATQTNINSDVRYGNTVKAGQVYGNTLVNMTGGVVESSIYGGGEMASVGTFETYYTSETATGVHFVDEPITCAENTGLAKVLISGGQAGLVDHATMPNPGTGTWDDDNGFVFCGSRGEADTITYPKAHLLAIVDTTYLEISGDAIIAASVYGGSENGMVIHDTHVKIKGGQIGVGYDATTTPPSFFSSYTAEQWNAAINAIRTGVMTDALAAPFHPCDAWAYGNGINSETGYPNGPFYVYDPFADPDENPTYTNQALAEGAALVAKDGNSFFGKVYGGGSGYYPIAPGVWRRSAGRVNGNTLVDIEGGHILTAVYGGNETTDVLSKATINMSGGTVGIPRTFADIVATPTVGHVFGSGLGDTRTRFNKWTNVNETEIKITGGTVFGSVFGGGADGHVLEDTKVTVNGANALIGTYGHTLFDGNVFGGGRGFSGNALTAGAVCGNTEVNIVKGQVLGSVYGGGRLASVGLDLADADDDNYGVLQDGTNHGYTTVNITGGTIGAIGTYEDNIAIGDHRVSGNVYGGSKGRLTQMDYTTMNPLWPSLGKVKQTEVNIDGSGVVIKGDVFGGGEIGTVLDSTNVFVSNGTLMRDLFGGGYGSISTAAIPDSDTIPVMVAGRVFGRTNATVDGGLVKHNVYGGGEYAKVGIDVNEVTTIPQSTVSLNGGVIGSHVPGVTVQDTLFGGMVYGGGMGILADTTVAMVLGNTYIYDTLSNNNTPAHVLGHIHGGGEKALVQKDTYLTLGSLEVGTLADATGTVTKLLPPDFTGTNPVTLYETRALEGGRVYGGGQGVEDVNYRSAAMVMGNTNTEVTGTAKVNGSVYGGGELANVGSGTLDTDKNTGSATVTISGGTIGPLNGSQRNGNVFGGGKGPEELSSDTYYALVDSTHVIIQGGANIAGSVFGGGANGRVLGNASTDIQGGTIGTTGLTTWDGNVFGGGRNLNAYANTTGAVFGNVDIQMSDGTIKGNMYGGGRFGSVGMDYNSEHVIDTIKDTDGKTDHGHVNINITGGTIGGDYVQYLGHYYDNGSEISDMPRTGFVFGGGRGIMDADKIDKLGNVKGTTVTVGGDALVKSSVYGGSERGIIYKNTLVKMTGDAEVGENSATMALHRGDVYGGGCGFDSIAQGSTYVFLPESGRVKGSTRVEMDGSNVYGNIFGGGEEGHVIHNTYVVVTDGTVGITGSTGNDGNVFGAGRGKRPIITGVASAAVSGNTQVDIQDGRIKGSVFGGGDKGSVGVYLTETTVNGVTYQPGDTIAGTDHGYTLVNVSGGWIGHEDSNGRTGGNVYGGCRGAVVDPDITTIYQNMAHVKQTEVNIFESDTTDTFIMGSVFGGGEDGHVFKDTYVNVSDGQIGGSAYNPTEPTLCNDLFHGNVYGGGRGLDTYTSGGQQHYSPTAGMVYGNTNVMITGGRVCRNVYGGGNLSSVGIADEVPVNGVYKTGLASVTLTQNAKVGVSPDSNNRNGLVFGSGKGMAGEAYKDLAMVKNTKVVITGNSLVTGTVYGSGEDGHTRHRTEILIGDAPIDGDIVDGHNVLIGTYGLPKVDGNVYGGGRGLDTYTGTDGQQHYSSTAGLVGISTNIEINDGTVLGSVFGGGRLASVGYEDVLNLTTGSFPDDYGMATVLITGDAVIGSDTTTLDNGHVFGSGKGDIGENFINLAYVHETDVTVNGNAKVYGSVFGGGEDGHVKAFTYTVGEDTYTKEGNTHVTIGSPINNVLSTCNIGYENMPSTDMDTLRGNVYGGGRGLDEDQLTGNTSPTAGRVEGNSKVDILGGSVWHDVFGGGSEAVVMGHKVTNIVGGYVGDDVYGGSNFIPVTGVEWAHSGLKTVNVRGGHVHHNVYGCSHKSNDGVVGNDPANAKIWTSFVNINGGTIDGSVHGAGYAGLVNGSVCVNIGKDAIMDASNNTPRNASNKNYNKPHNGNWDQTGTVEPTASKLVIGGSVYGGSDYFGSETDENDFNDYDQTGYALIFIDGTGYNTTDGETATNYMNIGGGLFGSGTHTESGALGRHILLREYGTRNATDGEMTSATRTLTTIQRAGNVIIDHANVNLSGLTDISSTTNVNKYGVMRVSDTLAVINAGSIVLGSATPGGYAHMDSIYSVQSLNLASSTASIYNHNLNELKKHSWYWLGIQDGDNDAKLYNINGTGTNATVVGELTFAQENVVLYNDTSKLWVRYHEKKAGDATWKQYYGELLGFFRMRGDEYHPTLKDTVSFAYARPKITDDHQYPDDNTADGGWLSYNTEFNYFTDMGDEYTHTQQYPYINVLDYTRGDREDYRMWVDVSRKRRWYVDGTRGWGRDDKKKYGDQSGLFPDKPKKTLYGKDASNKGTGIVNEKYTASNQLYLNYNHKDDVIYVVGAISAADEKEMLRDSIYTGDETHYPLKLYRYPGGHTMSNGKLDYGGANAAIWGQPNGVEGDANAAYRGPGANYGAMLNVQEGTESAALSLEMRGVIMDGLYGYTEADALLHEINDPSLPEDSRFNPALDSLPLVLTHRYSELSMHGGTVLMRGYNNQNAADWYTDSDYKSYRSSGMPVYNGGAMFVDSLAVVNVCGLDSVTIVDNKQYLKIGDEDADIIESNVYLPTFATHLYIPEALASNTRIGVTSPNRNKEPNYMDNTFSPVAEVYDTVSNGFQVAQNVWTNNNFYDDLNWFFVNGYNDQTKRTTYFEKFRSDPSRTVYFGWTWANVVRQKPENYTVNSNSISISSEEGLAWLISVVNGLNRQPASSLSGKTVSLATAATGDIKDIYDMQQYVWVPVGDPSTAFAGTFDGKGHLINNLAIEYLGKGDKRYERSNYGMFGYVEGGTINRTFLPNGPYSIIRPVGTVDIAEPNTVTYNIGGLVGSLDGTVSNSEAAVNIYCIEKSNYEVVAGGLVGNMEDGEIHSSMAMPNMNVGALTEGPVGGLVGSATTGEIYNSFVNAKFDVAVGYNDTIGGLLGTNIGAEMSNCYMAKRDSENLTRANFGNIAAFNAVAENIKSCYAMYDPTYYLVANYDSDDLTHADTCDATCGQFKPVVGADYLGYMYADNMVVRGNNVSDTTMFVRLNEWVDRMNGTDHKYARWSRPGLSEINGDLPVLMLSEYDNNTAHQGGFRSVGTYAGGPFLQYGGPVRDNVEVDGALARTKADTSSNDYLFIYGDVNSVDVAANAITQRKVSIYEHAAIMSAGSLSEYDSTYVGITFDNSRRHALSTNGVNGLGMQDLPRDWHMFSTPLNGAALGFNYQGHNINTFNASYPNYNHDYHYNNPWITASTEYSWLTTQGSDECAPNVGNRYWMNTFDPDNRKTDGYFPTHRGNLFDDNLASLFINGSDECPSITNNTPNNRYPYGMDFFTWYEPQYHWINFKRNGPNHWHSDEPHVHLDYCGDPNHIDDNDYMNKNEESLIVGKGYMAAISVPTFLQSHGRLNNGDQSINLTARGTYCTGWNLVGNPFHGYLDFDEFASQNNLGNAFYYIYDADGYQIDDPESAFLVYPTNGSINGAYAGQYLHPHQAFFVLADNDQELRFTSNTTTASMIVSRSDLGDSENDGHFRNDKWRPEYPLVNLFLSSDRGCSDVTVIEFERPEWGGALKLPELRNGNGMFYGYHDQGHYAALFAEEGTQRVPLWFEAKEDDIFTMKWNTANGDFSTLYLIDNINGVQYDMLANDAYTFEGHKDDYYSRFYIVFNVTDIEEHTEPTFAFFDGSQWVVTGKGELDFIDLQGRILWHGKLSGGQSRLNFPVVAKGMYLLRLVNSNETKVQKIIVK